jgi:PKD repeat protein
MYSTIAADEEKTIEDPQGDVIVFNEMTSDLEDLTTTDEKPNIDLKQVSYAKNTGNTKVTITIEVYGEIEDKGDLESEDFDSLNLISYSIILYTSQNGYYELNYINQTCQLLSGDKTENITDFTVNGGILTINFDLLSADETYDEMIVNTVELDFSSLEDIGYYMDMAPDEPMTVDAGGPYDGEVNEDIEFTGTILYPGKEPYTYQWDFGDGETSTVEDPTHSYDSAGNYTIKFTVTDNEGKIAMQNTTITITKSDTPNGNGNGGNNNQNGDGTDNGLILFIAVIAIIVIIGIVVIIFIIRR